MTEDTKSPIIELAAERLRLAVVKADHRHVRVRTETFETQDALRPELSRADVTVTRVACNRDVDQAPPVREEDGVTIIPVLEERLVLRRQLVLREEIHVRRTTSTETLELPVTLRRQRAVVERLDAATGTPLSQDILTPEGN